MNCAQRLLKALFFSLALLLLPHFSQAYLVQFSVDMSHVTGVDSVFIAGDFQSWCVNCTGLSDQNGDDIWEITLDIPQGTHEYKFTLGSWSNNPENLFGSNCSMDNPNTQDGNRLLNVTGDMVLPVVCYDSCLSCEETYHDVTFQVDMNYVQAFQQPNSGNQVYVYGDFNAWCQTCNPMDDSDGDGIWTSTLSLANGTYQYKHTYGGDAFSEGLMESDFCTTSGMQYNNRILEVSGDSILTPYCFNTCYACSEITREVTFQLDMNYCTLPFTAPAIAGEFNNWCGSCHLLSDDDGDNIWTLTTRLLNRDMQYKYSVDNNQYYEDLQVTDACAVSPAGYANRLLSAGNDTILPIVCWGRCLACTDLVKSVKFQLDLSIHSGFLAPEVNGSFDNFNLSGGCCEPMTDENNDGIWETTKLLLPGYHEYRYSVDHHTYWEGIPTDAPCAVSYVDYAHRFIQLQNDTILPPVCWSQCVSCSPPTPDVIELTSISPGELFSSETFNLDFQVNGGNFNAANEFILQLSGLDGTYTNPFTLATIQGTTSASFQNVSLPISLPANCYRLRVISTNPAVSSNGWDELKVNSLTAQQSDYALRFDGQNDYANLGPILTGGDFTFSCWIKPDSIGNSVGNAGGIVDFQNDLYLYGNPQVNDNYVLSHLLQFDMLPGRWNHFTVTMDAENHLRKVYLFGQLIDQNTWDYVPEENHRLLLGITTCQFCGGAYKGLMDEVKIWNYALSADEVFAQVQTSLTGSEEGLLGYYTFNEGCQSEVTDQSPNANNGILMNGTQRIISDVPVWETNISPNEGGNINIVNVTIHDFFQTSAISAILTKIDSDTIHSEGVYMQNNSESCIVSWNLANADTGMYDIDVTLVDGTHKIYPSGFHVVQGVLPDVWVDIIGRNVWRNGRPFNFLITYGNNGNVDAKGVPLYLVISGDTLIDVQMNFNIKAPSTGDAQWLADSIPTSYNYSRLGSDYGQFRVFPLYLPIIRPGEIKSLSFSINNISAQSLGFRAYTTLPYYASPLNEDVRDCAEGLVNEVFEEITEDINQVLPGVSCVVGAYDAGSAIVDYINGEEGIGSTAWNIVSGLTGCADLIPAVGGAKLAKTIITVGVDAVNAGINTYNCGKALEPKDEDQQESEEVNSYDPNEKIGPSNYQNLEHDFNYAIYFENKETASAAAQQVFIFDTLDVASFNLASFEFGGFGWADIYQPNSAIDKSHLHEFIDLRPTKNLVVEVAGEINLANGVVTWIFTSLDPETMQLTEDPILGFLDPNDFSGRGQGFVQYNVAPLDSLETGHEILNSATIIFDFNPPITTNTWQNTIDLIAPVSEVVGLPDNTLQPGFDVSWVGRDSLISGIDYYKVFVKENDGEYVLWLSNYRDTVAHFTGYSENWYSFFTVAVDSAGNEEPRPAIGDDSTYVFFTYYQPTIDITSQNISCAGSSDGAILTSIVGGNQPFTILINGVNASNETSNLPEGTYQLSIINALQMTEIDTLIQIVSPDPLQAELITTALSGSNLCDGSIEVTPTGGLSPYTIAWANPANETAFTLNNLCEGIYTATITDSNGCTVEISSISISVNVSEKPEGTRNLSVSPNPASNSVTISVTDKYLGMRYTITDDNGKTVRLGTITSKSIQLDISSLANGNYLIKVGDDSAKLLKRQ